MRWPSAQCHRGESACRLSGHRRGSIDGGKDESGWNHRTTAPARGVPHLSGFSRTVEPNEHALADITTLVRGRVIDVYADLGREVKGGTLLALLYSSELGMAQSAYLKATAKLNVADRAFRRAELLLKEKVIGVAELQRREGEMLSLRAELREARDRLLILGLTDEDLRNLDRNHTIRSHVPVVAPSTAGSSPEI